MSVDIRLPNITAPTTEGKMMQMQSYMHQLVQQLNFALSAVDSAASGNTSSVVMSNTNKQVEDMSPEEAANTFNSIKALIIKSADIVTAYEEKMRRDFNGEYVAISDFGTYKEQTNYSIDETSRGVEELYTKVETIGDDVNSTKACIKRGELGVYINGDLQGKTAVGVGVGDVDENDEFKAYAWFTANRLSFLDGFGYEVAYISQNRLYIRDAIFFGTVQFNGYKMDTSDGIAFTWIGG